MDTPFELPGFSTPGHPKDDARSQANAVGDISEIICDRYSADQLMPAYKFFLTRENGRVFSTELYGREGAVVSESNEDNTVRHVLRINGSRFLIYPGTYKLRVLIDAREVFNKSITVGATPGMNRDVIESSQKQIASNNCFADYHL